MIEVVYNGETKQPDAPGSPSGKNLKNIRQIGKAGGSTKLYVEDTVMRFLQRRIRRTDPPLIALLGSENAGEEATRLFVTGAILAKKIEVHGNRLEFAADAFTDIYEESAAYFAGSTILGWFLPSYEAIGRYADVFGEAGRLFLLEETSEQEEVFYVRRQKRLTRLEGYYTYYQNNEQMRLYQQKCEREELARTEEKTTAPVKDAYTEDEAILLSDADDQPRLTMFLYAVSTVLAIVILVIGIAMIGSYERMYEMQDAIETIAGSIVNGALPTQTPQTDNDALPSETPDLPETEIPADADNALDVSNSAAKPTELETAYSEGTVTTDGEGTMLYTIQKGDTLAAISRRFYQTEEKVTQILAANMGLLQDDLVVGEKIILP